MRYFEVFRVWTVVVYWISLFFYCKHNFINVFVSLNCIFSFASSLRKKLAHFLFIRSNGETHWKKHFSSQRNDSCFPTFKIKVSRFQGFKVSRFQGFRVSRFQGLKGVFAKNERGYRLNAIKKRFWSLLILLLSVAFI